MNCWQDCACPGQVARGMPLATGEWGSHCMDPDREVRQGGGGHTRAGGEVV